MKRAIVLVSVLATAAIAAAQRPPAATTPAPKREKNIAIEGEQLKGELPAPQGEQAAGRGRVEPGDLIVVRADFVREIVRSVEEL